jgi:hypothetical protein
MPERVVNFLTGYPEKAVFPIPLETWDDFDLDGTEVMDCELSRVANHSGRSTAGRNARPSSTNPCWAGQAPAS